MEVFRAFAQDADDFAGFAKTKLQMPLLVLSGEKAGGPFLIEQGKMVASNVEGVLVKGAGHWLMEEAPDQVIPKLVEFLDRETRNAAACDNPAKNLGIRPLFWSMPHGGIAADIARACGYFQNG